MLFVGTQWRQFQYLTKSIIPNNMGISVTFHGIFDPTSCLLWEIRVEEGEVTSFHFNALLTYRQIEIRIWTKVRVPIVSGSWSKAHRCTRSPKSWVRWHWWIIEETSISSLFGGMNHHGEQSYWDKYIYRFFFAQHQIHEIILWWKCDKVPIFILVFEGNLEPEVWTKPANVLSVTKKRRKEKYYST